MEAASLGQAGLIQSCLKLGPDSLGLGRLCLQVLEERCLE